MSSLSPTQQRALQTVSNLEQISVAEVGASPSSSDWLWLLNAGSMEARARSGITRAENLPGCPIRVVELMGKPYALLQYESPAKAKTAVETCPGDLLLSYAGVSAVQRILERLQPDHPAPHVSLDDPNMRTFPNGLLMIQDFLTHEEEREMISHYHSETAERSKASLKRGALHYGPHFDYTTFAVSKSHTPPPAYLTRLLDRLPFQGERDIPDQFTIQYYPPGTGIPPHVDTHSAFEESLYSLSFGASIPMQFRKCGAREARRMRLPKRSLGGLTSGSSTTGTPPPNDAETEVEDAGAEEWTLSLPPRSLLIMRGASRFGYTHGIKGRKFDQQGTKVVAREDRYSVTMRKIKPAEEVGCECSFPHVCDWRIRSEREEESQT